MAQSQLAVVPGTPDTGIGSSRWLQTGPHTDGMVMTPAGQLVTSGPDAMVLTRSGNGLWVLTRTAGGAETYYVRTTLGQMLRIGEPDQFGGFGGAGISYASKPYPPKGIGVIDAFVVAQIGVVGLTSATLRVGTTVYSATLAPVQTDLLAATAIGSLAVSNPADPLAQVVPVPIADQLFATADLSLLEVEFSFVMANTGTIAIAGVGAHIGFNFN